MRKVVFLSVLVALSNLSPIVLAQKVQDIPVTTTIEGMGIWADPTIENYRIQSDLFGVYQDGVEGVESLLQGSTGDWVLSTLNENRSKSTRRIVVDFRDPVPNSGSNPPFDFGEIHARTISKAHTVDETSFSGMTGLGSTMLAPLSIRFSFGGDTYRILQNPNTYPATDYILVTCMEVIDPNDPNSQCTAWRIEPSVTQPDGQQKNRAKLIRLVTVKGKTVDEDHGDFYMSFLIHLTNP